MGISGQWSQNLYIWLKIPMLVRENPMRKHEFMLACLRKNPMLIPQKKI